MLINNNVTTIGERDFDMATLVEIAAKLVEAQASSSKMTTDEILVSIHKVYAALKRVESGEEIVASAATAEQEPKPAITARQSLKKNEVICLLCGKSGMKTLTRHLSQAHDMKPRQYRKQFGIPTSQPLAAKEFTAKRKEVAANMNLAANLEKARAVRAANLEARAAKRKSRSKTQE